MAHTEGKPGSNGASSENIQTLETLATENPGNLEVLITLADAYSAQDNASGAISVYEKALALQPDNIDLLLALGTQWQSLGNFEQAKNTYQRALAINDKLPMLHYNMGIVYNELGLLDESASAYKQAMMLDPTNSDSRYGLAITLEKQRKYQDALEIYQVYASDPAARYLKEAKERIGVLQQSMSPATPAGAGNKPAPANQPPAQQPTGNGVIQNSDGIQAGGAAPVPQTPQLPRIELNGQPL